MHKYETTMSVYIPHMSSVQSIMWPEAGIHTFHIAGTCLWTVLPATLDIYDPLYSSCRLSTDPTLLHISTKNQHTTTFIYHTSEKYMPATNMPLKCQLNDKCPNYLMCINWGEHYYKCHIWTQWHQPYDQKCCTQTTTPTTKMTPLPDCID